MSNVLKVTVLVAVATLQGCSSMGIGKSEFACNGMPEGVKCMGTRDVYHATNNGNKPLPTTREGKKIESDGKTPSIAGKPVAMNSYNDDITRRHVEANLPFQPIPIRTPSQTMRIYVAPFEDQAGDLLVPGLVYTDVEKRRWVIGTPVAGQRGFRNSLRPLQVIKDDRGTDKPGRSNNPS